MKRIHIVGCPRSGTTLMHQLMSTCYESSGFCNFEKGIFKRVDASHSIYFSKKPDDLHIIEYVLKKKNNVHVICMLRDPRCVVSSIHYSNPEEYYCDFWMWEKCYDVMQKIRQHPKVLIIRYEDLLHTPDSIQRKIQSFCEELVQKYSFVDFDKYATPSLESLKAMRGLRSLDTSNIQSWMKHLPRVKQQLKRYPQMQQMLELSGYEKDSSWQKHLDHVETSNIGSYKKKRGILKDLEWRIRYRYKIWRMK
ncbi:sulfotransferase family protein [Candidatus Uabimicrobium amorphum]|uniref:Sulfotransferase domain-containing protein n=1 Tax=Uabimicrobium amorphum TaxID=2596890 RepID=A0A5S9INP7_UABAM|nr:sulfotransferase [Candidatus Uabimicrobium amorphum]BBM85074.1 hypothetical protein UABAM_03437 [Candidatus Uabimicrobium amorphum]